jgi:ubiquinone biosynthesis protein
MNAIGFIGLLKSIYGKDLPDLDRIQDRGLLAVKIAQHYALRIDFLDENVCRHLAKLYRQTRPLPPEDVDTLLRSYVDRSWFERVRHLAPTPFASASIGQIHRAELDDGTQVIVKLIKRDFTNSFVKDVRSLRRLLTVALTLYPKLRKVFDPMGILDHIEDYTTAELNLCNEVAGADTLASIRDDYEGRYDLSRMRLPQFYRELSNEKVLVAQLIPGKTFDELLDEGALSYEKLLELFGIHGFYLFGRGVFHGDIHPGNIIVDPDGNLSFVDTGALSRSGERIRRGLFWFFEALSRYDYPECARRLNDMAEKPIDGVRFDKFRGRFDELYRDFADRTVSEVSLTKKMMDTIKLGVNNGMEFGKGMFPVIKSLMYLDGMVLRCRPEAILLRDMRPFIDGFEKVL